LRITALWSQSRAIAEGTVQFWGTASGFEAVWMDPRAVEARGSAMRARLVQRAARGVVIEEEADHRPFGRSAVQIF
jgi:hypothetical protein